MSLPDDLLDEINPADHAAVLVMHLLRSGAASCHHPIHIVGSDQDGAVYEVVVVRSHANHSPEQLATIPKLFLD